MTCEQLQPEIGGHQCLRILDVGDNRIQVLILGFAFCFESKSNDKGFRVGFSFRFTRAIAFPLGLRDVTLYFSGAAAQLPATLLFRAGA